jgi:hypothetical protein
MMFEAPRVMFEAALRPQPKVIETITDRRGAKRDILYFDVPPFVAPPTNGKREVARCIRQIEAAQHSYATWIVGYDNRLTLVPEYVAPESDGA